MKQTAKDLRILQLDEDWSITADSVCFSLQRRRVGENGKSKGVEIWDNYAYHTDLAQMFKSASEYIALDNWPDLKLIVKKIEGVRDIVSVFMREIKP